MRTLTFNEWLTRQIWAEYDKQSRWTEDDTIAQINSLNNVELLQYFEIYQREMGL